MGSGGTRYENLSIVVTKPNGAKDTFGPRQADATGGIWQEYSPDVVGNYTMQAFYPGQNISSTNKYLPSQSEIITFTVQADPIQAPGQPPLPTEYWSRPIISINFDWGSGTQYYYVVVASARGQQIREYFSTTG